MLSLLLSNNDLFRVVVLVNSIGHTVSINDDNADADWVQFPFHNCAAVPARTVRIVADFIPLVERK